MWSIWAKDAGFGHWMCKSVKFKTCYGVTSPKDYAITSYNEEMSHRTLYDVKPPIRYAATFKIQGMTYPSQYYGVTSTKGYAVTSLFA